MSEGKAHFYCGIVAVIWGLGFIAVDQALLSFSCFDILLIRFLGSSILAWLLIIKDIKKIHIKTVKKGVINGTFLFIAYALQTYAQTLTSVSNNAFLSASGVVMVPYFCYLVFKKKTNTIQILSSCLCLIGIAILSSPCTLFFSRTPTDISLMSIMSCLYIVVFATFLCFFLQTKAQQAASASSCSVILSTESLFAVIFSVILLNESIHIHLLVGGLLILLSVILVQTSSLKIVINKVMKKE